MNNLIERQKAIDVICKDKIDSNSLKIMDMLGNGNEALTVNMTCDRHIQLLKNLPSVWSKIIRCKDCCFCTLEYDDVGNQYYSCTVRFDESGFWNKVEAEDFCSFAKRKTDERKT